jgi:hypothetical protein
MVIVPRRVRRGLAGLDVPGERGRVDRVLGVQGSAQRIELGLVGQTGQHRH